MPDTTETRRKVTWRERRTKRRAEAGAGAVEEAGTEAGTEACTQVDTEAGTEAGAVRRRGRQVRRWGRRQGEAISTRRNGTCYVLVRGRLSVCGLVIVMIWWDGC
jgi:hypothetical protein